MLDFAEDSGARQLDLGVDMISIKSGEVSAEFVPATPFPFEPGEWDRGLFPGHSRNRTVSTTAKAVGTTCDSLSWRDPAAGLAG